MKFTPKNNYHYWRYQNDRTKTKLQYAERLRVSRNTAKRARSKPDHDHQRRTPIHGATARAYRIAGDDDRRNLDEKWRAGGCVEASAKAITGR